MFGGASGRQQLLLAETLGLAMARRASEILERHRVAVPGGGPAAAIPVARDGAADGQFAVDNAIFTAVLDAANECLGQFDSRPADDRWCDALLQIITLSQLLPGPCPTPGRPARPAVTSRPARSWR
jgi:hypothetical protein